MPKKLGKIEKPPAEEFRTGRKLYFVPLIYSGRKAQAEYLEKVGRYWSQVETQMIDLELKLGKVDKVYHELISVSGDEGIKTIKELNDKSYQIVKSRLDKGAHLQPIEEDELLTEFTDWSRCLTIGLQNQKVFTKIYESYTEVSKKRNECITRQIDETLKADEIGILLMSEGYQVQFPPDIQVFFVTPPALDEIKRWLRDGEAKSAEV